MKNSELTPKELIEKRKNKEKKIDKFIARKRKEKEETKVLNTK